MVHRQPQAARVAEIPQRKEHAKRHRAPQQRWVLTVAEDHRADVRSRDDECRQSIVEVDRAEEKTRLSKAYDKLAKEIGGLKGRLNNPNFATSAPEEVVEECKTDLSAREDDAAKLQAALKRLAEIG